MCMIFVWKKVEFLDTLCYIVVMQNESYFEISKSKFYGYLIDVESIEMFNKFLDSLKLQHKKATHFCFAYIFDNEGRKEKFSDDKEPKGTAGLPIMNVLKRKQQTNKAIIVVRYFGGVKLGAGGLLRAYSKTASMLFN